ncbi:hypothetical protein HF1_06640 [Mycoplasma haemofelis str. Langford 1]|uniref:Uncharacterized protein n=1 Tax=Mycoplasma haemofelis (strain Langford 1) TaxID=941640 RepID=E8ZHQ1_MYCHL|nr:hypothetical protein [Mycoplasma haemofelis]CBY92672.1 hypothetical protein HF1_06640 [Mycoplasma haemofelis str. Langford 1]
MSDRSSLFPANLRVGLLAGSAALASIGTSSSLLLDSRQDNLKTIMESAGSAAAPVLNPIKKGIDNLSQQLDDFSKQSYNAGVDAKQWAEGNFSKVKIKSGWNQIYKNLSSWYGTAKSAAESASSEVKKFFQNWEDNKEILHIIFKSIGNSFSIIGGLVSSSSSGESKIKILFEVLSHEKFKDFAAAVGGLTSKNTRLFSQLQGDDIYDVLTAFRQEPDEVTGILNDLAKKEKDTVDRDVLVSALRLQSLMGKATALVQKLKTLLASENKEEAKKLKTQVEQAIRDLDAVIKSQESAEEKQ